MNFEEFSIAFLFESMILKVRKLCTFDLNGRAASFSSLSSTHVLPWLKQRIQGRVSLHFVRDSLHRLHAEDTLERFTLFLLSNQLTAFSIVLQHKLA